MFERCWLEDSPCWQHNRDDGDDARSGSMASTVKIELCNIICTIILYIIIYYPSRACVRIVYFSKIYFPSRQKRAVSAQTWKTDDLLIVIYIIMLCVQASRILLRTRPVMTRDDTTTAMGNVHIIIYLYISDDGRMRVLQPAIVYETVYILCAILSRCYCASKSPRNCRNVLEVRTRVSIVRSDWKSKAKKMYEKCVMR